MNINIHRYGSYDRQYCYLSLAFYMEDADIVSRGCIMINLTMLHVTCHMSHCHSSMILQILLPLLLPSINLFKVQVPRMFILLRFYIYSTKRISEINKCLCLNKGFSPKTNKISCTIVKGQ